MSDSSAFHQRAQQLQTLINAPDLPYTRAIWRSWFNHSMVLAVDQNFLTVQNTIGQVQSILSSNGLSEQTALSKHWAKLRRKFQSTIYSRLQNIASPNAHDRFAHKLSRWNLHSTDKPLHLHLSVIQRTPNWQARCAQQRLRTLAKLTSPRVHAASFGAMWNRWCTRRRFQLRGQCRLCQKEHTEDSIEHYAFCSSIREVASRRLRLDPSRHVNLHTFTCTNPFLHSEELLTRAALLVYAVYRALNHQRQATVPLLGDDLFQAMSQWIIEGARGHARSCQVLSRTWSHSEGKRLPKIQ